MRTARTLLLILAAAAVGILLWAWQKSRAAGGSTGIWGTIGGLWGGASDLTQSVTEKSVAAGSTLGRAVASAGSGVASGAHGVIDIVDDALHVGGAVNPMNWF